MFRFPILTDCNLDLRISNSQSQRVWAKVVWFVLFVGEDCNKGQAVIDEEHSNGSVFVFQVGEGYAQSYRDSVIGGSVGTVNILQGVQ